MQPISGVLQRALIATAAVAATALAAAAPAAAHVHVDAADPAPGATSVLTFRVPGESDTGALTTGLSVTLPDVASARTELMPGWTSRLDRDVAAGTVRSVTWTAAPGTGISSDQFALFRVSVTLPEGTDTVSFPATQTYSDGSVVRWDEAPLPEGGEPEHPAPTLQLSGDAGPDHGGQADHAVGATAEAAPAAAGDATARWLAGAALVLAAVAVVVGLLGRRRS
ncbi:YcnI family protein [Mycobacterium sp. WMMD1722]|uniref:YcnI family copper-binding membrane protein n=1 Tax=Mycobacterium sp. WMMD1722 TaxID=3404117 RepID=UPI003BF575FD